MDRDKIYIDNTGIADTGSKSPDTETTTVTANNEPAAPDTTVTSGLNANSEFQYTSGPNPGQFVIEPEQSTSPTASQFDADVKDTEFIVDDVAADSKGTQFTIDDVAADSSQSAHESYGFDKIDFTISETPMDSGFSSNNGEPPNGGGNNGNEPPAGKRRRKKTESKPVNLTRSSLAAIIIICVFLSSAFGFGGAMLASNMVKPAGDAGINNTSNADTKGFDLEDATGSEMTVQEITEATLDSVVEIRTESVQMDSWMGQYVTEGAGSGVIIKENGYIITNNHVVAGASNIIVTTTDKKEYEATLIGTDPDTDVAVIKINAKDLKAATMGNSDQLNVGDLAVAIGNPLGELGGTVTAGIISALDRSISIDGKTMTLLQTDTSINPGNSGGGLFNQYGQLIGVVVAKSSGSDVEGLGFAIPINRAAEVASQLMDGGYVKGKPSTGMAYQDMSQQQQSSDMFGFGFDEFFGSSSMQSGVYIAEINGKNAKKAGFEIGDMVYSVDGQEIDSFDTLSSIITSHKVGDKVTYIVLRDGQALEIDLILEEKTE